MRVAPAVPQLVTSWESNGRTIAGVGDRVGTKVTVPVDALAVTVADDVGAVLVATAPAT